MQKKHFFKRLLTPVLLALALICLLIAFLLFRQLGVFDDRYESVREYAALLGKIDEVYIGEYEVDDIAAAAMHATVDALGDRWSYYLTPEEYVAYLDDVNNRFTGIGVNVVVDDEPGGMRVTSVFRGSAAETAGIVAGDVIVGIDGVDIAGWVLDEMKALLSRPIGEAADLTVLRADGSIVLLTVEYGYVFVDPVSFEMLDDHIGYIAISNFDRGAAQSFISAVKELMEQEAEAIVFDVRGNGGGLLVEMAAMLDYLLPEGEIFVAVDKSGREDITYSDADSVSLPFAVLINRYSFSAAEYFAAMLREYDAAVLVGEQTTGKNRMQTTVDLPGGGALHISSSQYLTKNRVSLYDVGGVAPDFPVAMAEDDLIELFSGNLDKKDDLQLQQAIAVLR